MSSPASSAPPIFILGITPRSGTNFLSNLLRLHPDCSAPAPIWEDFLVHYADVLVSYAHAVSGRWQPDWGVDRGMEDLLCQYLGNGLRAFLTSQIAGTRLVTKTPSVRNLRHFFRLFPSAHLLILVRDGRAVVESSVQSFGVNDEWWMRQWANAARTILHFDRATTHPNGKYLIVRYEELWHNLQEELCRIFAFLSLDIATYDFDAAMDLPVRGSSVFRRQGGEALHWRPEEKTAEFNPIQRWCHWSRPRHERFNWIAGQYLVQFGYEQQQYTTYRLLYATWNSVLDIRWLARGVLRAIPPTVKRIYRAAHRW